MDFNDRRALKAAQGPSLAPRSEKIKLEQRKQAALQKEKDLAQFNKWLNDWESDLASKRNKK